MVRPHVVVHVAISLDGFTTGFEVDVPRFYELISTWDEDVTLAGADTILAQEPALADAPLPGPNPEGPVLAVVDSRRRVGAWEELRQCGHWRDVVALRAGSPESPPGVDAPAEIVAGEGPRVDLGVALEQLAATHSARTLRVDSGGTLIGALLEADLVDELSLLLHATIAGEDGRGQWHGHASVGALAFERIAAEEAGDGLAWLRYRAVRP